MRWLLIIFLGLVWSVVPVAAAPTAKILKVLPHRLDKRGRHSLSPSLYERDAYQAYLRQHPAECSGLRFDVNWKAPVDRHTPLKLRVEIRSAHGEPRKPVILEAPVHRDWLGATWSHLVLDGEAFKKSGEVTAWRVSLWNGDQLLSECSSFLW